MKKLFLAISTVFLVLFSAMAISASAARYTELPITMNQNKQGTESMFTLTDFYIFVEPNDTPKYTNSAYISVYGQFNKGASMDLVFYCYDASGNHLKTITQTMTSSDIGYGDCCGEWEPDYFFELDVPDLTASIEVGTAYPGSWTNTYYYCKYMNVYSADDRALGIHDLLLPVYEKVGWHGPVRMYSLDGDEIEVPYCDIKAYQKVGWYLWKDYEYKSFVQNYDSLTKEGKYANAFNIVEVAIRSLEGTYYEQSLYEYKTKLMDAWRKKNNGPLAYSYHYVDKSNGDVSITFRNVSYKYITAFKVQFDCYDTFGSYINDYYDYYYCDDASLPSGEDEVYEWSCTPYDTDYIKNIRVTQVVYSDGSMWYR